VIEKGKNLHAETFFDGATPVQVFSSPAIRADAQTDRRLRLGRPDRRALIETQSPESETRSEPKLPE
jgi:hypothetical protein